MILSSRYKTELWKMNCFQVLRNKLINLISFVLLLVSLRRARAVPTSLSFSLCYWSYSSSSLTSKCQRPRAGHLMISRPASVRLLPWQRSTHRRSSTAWEPIRSSERLGLNFPTNSFSDQQQRRRVCWLEVDGYTNSIFFTLSPHFRCPHHQTEQTCVIRSATTSSAAAFMSHIETRTRWAPRRLAENIQMRD